MARSPQRRSPDRQRGGVPPARSAASFVGRRREVAKVRAHLEESRLVTLIGVGGVGKTSLANAVAERVASGFTDGVWLVDFTPHVDQSVVPGVIAAVLGVHDSSGRQTTPRSLAEMLRTKNALLLLDNCEHLAEAVAATVDAVLVVAPLVRILVTSREPLRVEGEIRVEVPPLSVPPPDAEQTGMSLTARDYDAVTLLMALAEDVRPGFAATADSRLVARLCRRLDGLPLALVLAAARLYTFDLTTVLTRLDDYFAWLARGRRADSDHHQTLWDCIAWSHQLCSPAGRELWARLSVFRGDFAAEDAVAVCGDDAAGTIGAHTVVDALDTLVHQSVVTRRALPDGQIRYYLLDALRRFGHEQLEVDGEQGVGRWHTRHAHHLRDLAVRAAAERFSPRNSDIVGRMRAVLPDSRAALDWCLDHDAQADIALSSVVALSEATVWFTAASVAEGRAYLVRALDRPDLKPSLLRVKASAYLAWFAVLARDADAAILVENCREEARALDGGEPKGIAAAYVDYVDGLETMSAGHRDAYRKDRKALELFTRALVGFERGDVPGMTHLASFYMSLAARNAGEVDLAVLAANRCVSNAERHGDLTAISWARWACGQMAMQVGDVSAAREHFRLSLRAQRERGSYWGTWMVDAVAWATAKAGEFTLAARMLGGAEVLRAGGIVQGVRPASGINPHDEAERLVRAHLTPQEYDTAFHAGRGLAYDDVLRLCLGERLKPANRPTTAATAPTAKPGLTRREYQVADLVAEGLTNKEIGQRLVIAESTARTHVENILRKWDLDNRAQITARVTVSRSQERRTPPASPG